MSKPEDCRALIAKAGRCDILVNNAGIQHVAPIAEFPTEKWDAIIAINLSSAFHTTAAALPACAAGWGRVINIASAHGLTASPYKSAYVAAKHGVVGLTKVALETAEEPITCNAICPGYVLTPLVEAQIPDTMAEYDMDRDDGDARGHARTAALEGASRPSSRSAARRCSCARTRPSRSPARRSASMAAGRRCDRRRRANPAVPDQPGRGPAGRPGRPMALRSKPRLAGRRRARRLHLGRARPPARGGRDRDRGDLGHLGRRAERRGAEIGAAAWRARRRRGPISTGSGNRWARSRRCLDRRTGLPPACPMPAHLARDRGRAGLSLGRGASRMVSPYAWPLPNPLRRIAGGSL
jgi:NAD(P)-dependent dehydrogenase (short-subunit alcohol dehydrogenase family)